MNARHTLASLEGVAPSFVSVCSCGWRSLPASRRHADSRWQLHVAGCCATTSGAVAQESVRVSRALSANLGGLRAAAIVRRADVREKRARLAAQTARARSRLVLATSPRDRARMLERGREIAGLSHEQLWWTYLGFGGALAQATLVDALAGHRIAAHAELDRVALALNEAFAERGFGYPLDYSSSA